MLLADEVFAKALSDADPVGAFADRGDGLAVNVQCLLKSQDDVSVQRQQGLARVFLPLLLVVEDIVEHRAFSAFFGMNVFGQVFHKLQFAVFFEELVYLVLAFQWQIYAR